MKFLLPIHFLIVFLFSGSVLAQDVPLGRNLQTKAIVEENLRIFNLAPDYFMNQMPAKAKSGHRGRLPLVNDDGSPLNGWQAMKSASRDQFFDQLEQKGEIAGNENVDELLETGDYPKTLADMETLGLRQATVPNLPWSDDYWPIYRGILGNRYADSEFGSIYNWPKAFAYIEKNPASSIFNSKDAGAIDQLAPGEKYDLLFGIVPQLTTTMWDQGRRYHDSYGTVETWMGICHGWAAGSIVMNRPLKQVTVAAFDGTPLTFYPSDIKALISLLWAQTQFPQGFIGGRCDAKEPAFDEVGRLTDPACFDNNPGSWHQAVVGMVGQEKRSFVLDAIYDYEVWNQPIIGYKYLYFNPQTLKAVGSLQEAVVGVADFSIDKFKKYRSPLTRKIVGISMDITYVVEASPSHQAVDLLENDHHSTASYLYDLELDENDKIIGGEWYENAHPDFLWTPLKGARPITSGDYFLLSEPLWDGKQPVPSNWIRPARTSARRSQPLMKIVESLLELSQK